MKFPTPLEPEKVKYQAGKGLKSLGKEVDKVVTTKERKDKAEQPVSLSNENGADRPDRSTISPEVARKFSLRYGVEDWPPRRREKD